jgi:hypothetical protein
MNNKFELSGELSVNNNQRFLKSFEITKNNNHSTTLEIHDTKIITNHHKSPQITTHIHSDAKPVIVGSVISGGTFNFTFY